MKYTIHPLLTGYFTVAFKGDLKFPKVENIPSFIFLILGENGEPLLVDTGFDMNHIPAPDSWGKREPQQEIPELLKSMGLKTSDIKKIIQTHLHWDHAAGLKYFPEAQIFIQSREIEGLFSLRNYEETSFCPAHWFHLRDRFVLIDGDIEIIPGITLIRTGIHTAGHQGVRIESSDRTVLLAGDSPFTYEWLWTLVPDNYWDIYRQTADKSFFWQDELLPEIKAWFSGAKIMQGKHHDDYTFDDLKKTGYLTIFSHDPGLAGKKIL